VVTVTATPAGGTAPLSYKWWFYNGSTWPMLQDWGAGSTYAWTLPAAGPYQIRVWARSAGNSDDSAEAIGTLEKLLKSAPAHPDSYVLLAKLYEQQGKRAEAVSVFRRAAANEKLPAAVRAEFRARTGTEQP